MVAALQTVLGRFDWRQVEAVTLAILLEGCIAIRRGVSHLMPPTLAWSAQAREYLYTHFWILRAQECGIDPQEPMRAIALPALAGPLAWEEIARRIGAHPGGIAAGLLPLAMEDERPNVIPELLRTLRKIAWKHIPRRLQRKQCEHELDSAIRRTIFDRLRQLDPLDASVRALDGAADILPKAAVLSVSNYGTRFAQGRPPLDGRGNEDVPAMRRHGSHAAPLHSIEPHGLSGRVPSLSVHGVCDRQPLGSEASAVDRHAPEGKGGRPHARTPRGSDRVL